MAENLVVVSKVKKLVKGSNLRAGKDFLDALSSRIENDVKSAISRVVNEGKRKTLGAEDVNGPAAA